MASTYVNDLRLNEMATGDQSGSWGTVTNTNLELIAEAFSFGTEGITTNADTHTTTIADGATDPGRSMFLKYTGTLDSACTITLGPNTVSKLWFIENGTSGSQNIIISQGSGANITIPPGDTKAIYSDGAGSGAAMVDAFASLSVVDLKVQDDLTVTDDASVGGDLLVSGEVQTANIGFTDGDNAMVIADGGGVTFPIASVFTAGFAANAACTITTADNLSGLIVASTDADAGVGPTVQLFRNSSSPADNDLAGNLLFVAENDASEATVYANLGAHLQDVTNGTEDGKFFINTMVAGAEKSRMFMTSTESVFNEDSADIDFRVESNGNANMLFVDGGNDAVGIGTSSPSNALHVNSGASNTAALFESTDAISLVSHKDNSTTNLIASGANGNNYVFYNGSEAMRIDSSGNVIVGKTAAGDTGAGVTIQGIGKISAVRDGGIAAKFVRESSDGNIVEFVKDTTTVGSIGADGSAPYFATAVGSTLVGIKMQGGSTPRINPTDGNGDSTDGIATIGFSSSRFKDLYLSGGVYLGGTGAANKLDDYEEGTWTPVLKDTTNTGTTIGSTGATAMYTKIGRICHFTLNIQRNDAQSLTGNFNVTGLPFTSADTNGITTGTFWLDNSSGDFIGNIYMPPNGDYFRLKDTADTNDYILSNEFVNGRLLYLSGTYTTT